MTTLLVAATGGHLKQLHLLSEGLEDLDGPRHWVTFDKEQSRSLLESTDSVDFVPFIGSRDPGNTIRGFRAARRVLAEQRPDAVVSTGSAVAIPYMVLGRLRGARCTYIESAARSEGPSLTGRMVSRIPGVELRTQYEQWADDRWQYTGSVFDTFTSERRTGVPAIRKVVVTLGTLEFDFSRLADRIAGLLPDDVEVLWQSGGTSVGATGKVRRFMPESELKAAMADADVVIAHAGVGSALLALEAGKCPILVPRRVEYDEHIDDHQEQIAAELVKRGLAVTAEADTLDHQHLLRSVQSRVRRTTASLRSRPT